MIHHYTRLTQYASISSPSLLTLAVYADETSYPLRCILMSSFGCSSRVREPAPRELIDGVILLSFPRPLMPLLLFLYSVAKYSQRPRS